MRIRITLAVLLLPSLAMPAAKRLIPGWYEPAVTALGFLMTAQAVAALYLIFLLWQWCIRPQHRLRRSPIGVIGTVAIAAWICVAFLLMFDAGTREGAFLCGRELVDTYPCPQGGAVYTYYASCIAGNLKVQYAVRRNWLPMMYDWSDPVDPSMDVWSPGSICTAVVRTDRGSLAGGNSLHQE